ncbi:hypothetical protein HMPREF3088_05370 [Corynebacterium sp. HMSC22B11]|uniref:hypothetical protein n=1 Tax=Corynebacterium sp. HMSC22B11 TaxID=1581056 RepID=UPI0008A28C8E|nr:hypothetical protein [Corynebacterium sp. HMSC22B11]OFO13755.1 hypothetical protein HMPREF3088_05370 [Corynebacterium sp. HMSC22B11]
MSAKTFTWTINNGPKAGKTITLPADPANKMGVGFHRRHRKESPEEQMWVLVEALADDKNLELIDTLWPDEFAEFMEAWQGGSMGESNESSES